MGYTNAVSLNRLIQEVNSGGYDAVIHVGGNIHCLAHVVFCVTGMSPFVTQGSVEEANQRKILPQDLANLTQPYFGSICSCTNDIVYAMFEDLRTSRFYERC